MGNEEVFDDEFYQEDFSTASEWEAFLMRLSDIFEAYEVSADEEPLSFTQLSLCEWTEECEEVLFNDFDLTVTRYKAKIEQKKDASTKSALCQVFQDLISTENDICILDTNYLKHDYENLNAPPPPKIHPITVWYGLRDFAVIKNKRRPLNDISQIKHLQSSMNLAAFDSKCKIPVFVQVSLPLLGRPRFL